MQLKAGNGTRTRDPNLGKVVLYQLSYSRNEPGDGGEGNRTPDLLNAIQALSQLSYAPRPVPADSGPRRKKNPADRNHKSYSRVLIGSR